MFLDSIKSGTQCRMKVVRYNLFVYFLVHVIRDYQQHRSGLLWERAYRSSSVVMRSDRPGKSIRYDLFMVEMKSLVDSDNSC